MSDNFKFVLRNQRAQFATLSGGYSEFIYSVVKQNKTQTLALLYKISCLLPNNSCKCSNYCQELTNSSVLAHTTEL